MQIVNLTEVYQNELKGRKRHYETIFIVNPQMSDADAKELIEKNSKVLSQYGGTSLRQDDWGKRRMAYIIEKHQMGRYIYFRYIAPAKAVSELERSLKLDAQVMRYQTVKLSEVLSQEEIDSSIERATREASSSPAYRQDEEDLEAATYA